MLQNLAINAGSECSDERRSHPAWHCRRGGGALRKKFSAVELAQAHFYVIQERDQTFTRT